MRSDTFDTTRNSANEVPFIQKSLMTPKLQTKPTRTTTLQSSPKFPPTPVIKKSPLFRKNNDQSISIFNPRESSYIQTREIKRVFEEWEKSPNITIDTKISPQFDISMNANYRTKHEPMKDRQSHRRRVSLQITYQQWRGKFAYQHKGVPLEDLLFRALQHGLEIQEGFSKPKSLDLPTKAEQYGSPSHHLFRLYIYRCCIISGIPAVINSNAKMWTQISSVPRVSLSIMKDIHIAKSLFDEKLYFKSVSGFMSKDKAPISETKRHFNDARGETNGSSLARDSLDCIPESFSHKAHITIQQQQQYPLQLMKNNSSTFQLGGGQPYMRSSIESNQKIFPQTNRVLNTHRNSKVNLSQEQTHNFRQFIMLAQGQSPNDKDIRLMQGSPTHRSIIEYESSPPPQKGERVKMVSTLVDHFFRQ